MGSLVGVTAALLLLNETLLAFAPVYETNTLENFTPEDLDQWVAEETDTKRKEFLESLQNMFQED